MAKMSRGAYYLLVFVLILAVAGSFTYAYMWDTDTTAEDVEEYATTLYNNPEELTTPYNVDVNVTRILDNNTVPATDTWAVAVHYTIGSGITKIETYGTNWTIVSSNDTATDNLDKFSLDINQTDLNTIDQYTYSLTLNDQNYTDSWTKSATVKLRCNKVVFIVASKDYSVAEYHMKIMYGDASEYINIDVVH